MRLAHAHDQQGTDGAGADRQRDGQRNDGYVLLHVVGLHGRLALGHAQCGDEKYAAGTNAERVHGDAEDVENHSAKQIQQYAGDQRGGRHFPGQPTLFLA
ncbi:hypothetical protein D3C87_1830430 [compost metagenome]